MKLKTFVENTGKKFDFYDIFHCTTEKECICKNGEYTDPKDFNDHDNDAMVLAYLTTGSSIALFVTDPSNVNFDEELASDLENSIAESKEYLHQNNECVVEEKRLFTIEDGVAVIEF